MLTTDTTRDFDEDIGVAGRVAHGAMAQAQERLLKLAIALLAAFCVRVAGGDVASESAWLCARFALLVQVVGMATLTFGTLRAVSRLPEGAVRQEALKKLRSAGRSRVLATVLVAGAHARARAPPALLAGASALALARAAIHPLTRTFLLGAKGGGVEKEEEKREKSEKAD